MVSIFAKIKKLLIIFEKNLKKILPEICPKILKWRSKINFEIFRNDVIHKIFRNNTRNFPKRSMNFSTFAEILQNNSWNFPKYFLKFYEIILEIIRNNRRNCKNLFLKIFRITLKNFDNISWNFPKYFSKFPEFLLNNFRDFSKWRY